jgi:uncharacterized protein YneR
MKNIHLIPTTKEQHAIIQKNTGLLLVQTRDKVYTGTKLNIYITSDEEIKEGDWVLGGLGGVDIKKYGRYFADDWKKIILTTDQDLIKDGVQTIDDEFLQWFVKNPSCEEIKVRKNPKVSFIVKGKGVQSFNQGYKIIIPREEPKQTDEKGNPMTYWGGLKESKQETFEEASWRYNPVKKLDGEFIRQAFKEGAKWQAERMYSKEDMEKAFQNGLNRSFDSDFDRWFEQFKK